MTTAQLIARLQEYPPETLVLVDGYEDGFDDIDKIEVERVILDDKTRLGSNYSGKYETPIAHDAPAIAAVVLRR